MRRLAAIGAALAALGSVALSSQPSYGQQATTVLPPAIQSVSSCFDRTGVLEVLFLVDESGSLRDNSSGPGTDPLDQRVAAIKAALSGLARAADRTLDGRELRVDVLLTAFSAGYSHVSDGWQTLDGSTVQGLIDTADRFGELDRGLDTDYGTALSSAGSDLADRSVDVAGQTGQPPCQVLLFFTDGRYDIGDRTRGARLDLPPFVDYAPDLPLNQPGNGAGAVERGRAFLCDANGVADVIRANGAVTITVALDVNLDASARNFLDALTDGSSPESTCGTTGSESTGHFVSASRSDDLLFAFSRLLDPRQEILFCTTPAPVPCTFEVIEGISGFVLVTSAPVDNFELELTSPAGGVVRLRPDDPPSLALGSTVLTQRRFSPRALEVEAALDPAQDDGVGTWTIAFIDPSGGPVAEGGSYTIEYLAEIVPGLVEVPVLQKGEAVTFELGLFDPAGEQIVDSPLVDGATTSATITDPTTGVAEPLTVREVGRGVFQADYEPARDLAASTLLMTLDATLSGLDGVALTSERRSIELELRPPQDFPRIEPSQLDLPTIVGDGAATGTFTVIGSDIADGCVWFEPLIADLPDGTTTPVEVTPGPTTQDTCVAVPQGTSQTIDVSIDPSQAALGTVSGDLQVNLSSSTSDDVQRVSLPIRATMDVVPDAGTARNVLIALLLLGLLFPLVTLHLLNRLAARFAPEPQLIGAKSFSVVVQNGTLTSLPDQPELSTDYRTFTPIAYEGSARRVRDLSVEGVSLKTHASGWFAARRLTLLSGPFGSAQAGSAGVIAGGDAELRSFPSVPAHEVPLAVPGTWLFFPDRPVAEETIATNEPVAGQLVLFIRLGGAVDAGETLLSRATAAVPLRLSELASMARSLPKAPTPVSERLATVDDGDAGWDDTPGTSTPPSAGSSEWSSRTPEPEDTPVNLDPPESSSPDKY